MRDEGIALGEYELKMRRTTGIAGHGHQMRIVDLAAGESLETSAIEEAAAKLMQEYGERLAKELLGAKRAGYQYLDVVEPAGHNGDYPLARERLRATVGLRVGYFPADFERRWRGLDVTVQRYDLDDVDYDVLKEAIEG